jgi:hypothetical protein
VKVEKDIPSSSLDPLPQRQHPEPEDNRKDPHLSQIENKTNVVGKYVQYSTKKLKPWVKNRKRKHVLLIPGPYHQ